jgi:hypothetical protein
MDMLTINIVITQEDIDRIEDAWDNLLAHGGGQSDPGPTEDWDLTEDEQDTEALIMGF